MFFSSDCRGSTCSRYWSVLHTTHILRLSEDLPVVIEVVDTKEQIDRLIPIPDEMIPEGLVTLEKVHLLQYKPGNKPRRRERTVTQ